MILSRSAETGLRVMLLLAREEGSTVRENDIANELEIEPHFLSVMLRKLREAGLLEEQEHVDVGIRFARPSSEITLQDVVVALEGWKLFTNCILGLPGCGELEPCPLHDRWAIERERLALMFQSLTLKEAAFDVEASGMRLTPD